MAFCALFLTLEKARSQPEAALTIPNERPGTREEQHVLSTEHLARRFGEVQAFSPEKLARLAKGLANEAYVPEEALDPSWASLSFDQHRAIRFREEYAVPLSADGQLELQLLPPGRSTNNRVRVNIVSQNEARAINYDPALFSFDESAPANLPNSNLDFSGFRLHVAQSPNQVGSRTDAQSVVDGDQESDGEGDPAPLDEFFVFQGASYFRAVAREQTYGLSARGLAIGVGDKTPEEFPVFREFWIEQRTDDQNFVTVYALMDSASATGIYTFKITPGEQTIADISAVIFPRVEIDNFGLASLTSMFLFDETNRHRFDDFRTNVHDSDGLAIHNGAGEWLWRPLANPNVLQESAFVDRKPRGFGLIQRARDFENYGDLSLHYEDRPSVWIEPKGNWGAGAVTLVELPTTTETDDNIVAYWRPSAPFLPGVRYEFAYRQTWAPGIPITNSLLKVIDSRLGTLPNGRKVVVIDYLTNDLPGASVSAERANSLASEVYVTGGRVYSPVLELNPHTGGVRLTFQYDPLEENFSEFRVLLSQNGQAVSEKWLYRWTR